MSNLCPICGLLKTGHQAMGLAMAQCICQFKSPTQAQPTYGEMMSREKALDAEYKMGWNSALEMAAARIEHDFKKAFGKDTLTSFSAYLREMKK